jgi:hypothetical protein
MVPDSPGASWAKGMTWLTAATFGDTGTRFMGRVYETKDDLRIGRPIRASLN